MHPDFYDNQFHLDHDDDNHRCDHHEQHADTRCSGPVDAAGDPAGQLG
jgi:hypothetical protein